MGKVYNKVNGEVTVGKKETKKEITQPYYLDLYDFLKDRKGSIKNQQYVRVVNVFLGTLEKNCPELYVEDLNTLVYRVLTCKNVDELISEDNENSLYNIVNNMMGKYYKIRPQYEEYYKSITKKFENSIDNMIAIGKEILKRLIKADITRYGKVEQFELHGSIINGKDPLELLSIDGLSFVDLEDETLKFFIRKNYNFHLNLRTKICEDHLCLSCATPVQNCPKLLDCPKKNIGEYDFIVDGEQMTHTELKKEWYDHKLFSYTEEITDKFLVTRCRKFTPSSPVVVVRKRKRQE